MPSPPVPTSFPPVPSRRLPPCANAKAQENIIAYYDADGDAADRPMKGGYYRVLIGRTADGRAVVQDFYQDSRTKQINPVIIAKDSELKNFSSDVIEGLVVWYTPRRPPNQFCRNPQRQTARAGKYGENGSWL